MSWREEARISTDLNWPQRITRIRNGEPGSKDEVNKERRNPEFPTDFG